MSRIAFLFPGQGSQSVGMGKDLNDNVEVAKKAFMQIDEAAGRSLSSLCFNGPEEELKRTINTQPTILAVSLAALRAFQSLGAPQPDFVAGHSLGEFSALVCAGVFQPEAAVKLVGKRAQLMEDCPRGAMSAVIGVPADALEKICKEATEQVGGSNVVIVANFNTPEQLVISGSPDAVTAAGAQAKTAGGKVIPLPVGGAFHSPLMAAAASEFEQTLKSVKFNDATVPVIQNCDARPSQAAAELQSKLSRQMPSSVRWCETIQYMLSQGVDRFVEIGPGKALSGMVKKINRSAATFNVYDLASLNATLQELKQGAAVS